jgi:acylphosphatase
VRNLATGSVEAEFEGGEEQVAAMLAWFSTGSPLSMVSRVEHQEIAVTGEDNGFEIRY